MRTTRVHNWTHPFLTLRHAQSTPVGDENLRGVSGGEKKRVSISEALAARSLLGCWDNSTRGLDASTALEFVRAGTNTTSCNTASTQGTTDPMVYGT